MNAFLIFALTIYTFYLTENNSSNINNIKRDNSNPLPHPPTSYYFVSFSGEHAYYLTIDDVTGTLSVANRIDRDGPSGLAFLDQLQLMVIDSEHLTTSVDLNITVNDANDNSPTFSSLTYQANVTEGAAQSGKHYYVLYTIKYKTYTDKIKQNLQYKSFDSSQHSCVCPHRSYTFDPFFYVEERFSTSV